MSIHMPGDFKGGFEYNIIRGEGTLTLHSKDYTIRATHAQLEVKDVGVYTKADKGLDIKAFLAQTQSPVLGMWYESQGELGTILFSEDGTLQVEMMGQIYFGTYTLMQQAVQAPSQLRGKPRRLR